MIKTNSTKEIYNSKDYFGGEISFPKSRQSFLDKKIQFNQNDIDKFGCVYHAGTGCIADNVNNFLYEPFLKTLEQRKYKYGYKDGLGMYIYKGVDMVRDLWNEFKPDDKVTTYRVKLGGEDFYEALDKGYSVHTGYYGSKEYNQDKRDGILDGKEFGSKDWGHSIRIYKKDGNFIVDNYNQDKPIDEDDNVYEIKYLDNLIKTGTFFNYGYTYIMTNDNKTQLEKDIDMIQYAIDNGITNNQQNLVDIKKGNYTVDIRMTLMTARVHKDLSNK